MNKVIIIDNSPMAYRLTPENAIPIKSWFDDPHDFELMDLIPILEALSKVKDVRKVIFSILSKLKSNVPTPASKRASY